MASSSYQKMTIVGNLGKDPESRFTPSGSQVTKFSVAVDREWTNAADEHKSETIWFEVETWGRQAEVCSQFLRKGSKVLVDGEIKPLRIWTGTDGQARCNLELKADTVKFLSSKNETAPVPAEAGQGDNW